MRRSAHSTLSALAVGIFWATAAAGAFVGGLHLWAPPGPDQLEISSEAVRAPTQVVELQRRSTESASVSDAARAMSGQKFGMPSRESLQIESQRILARGIQQELIRVGCYAGAVDGKWSEGTRSAMASFNAAVGARLPVAAPDYILLTMLQGHRTPACAAKAAPTVVVAKPAPRVVAVKEVAKPTPAIVPPAQPSVTELVLIAPPAPVAAPVKQLVLPVPERIELPTSQHQTTLASDVASPMQSPSAAPLPGRMAVGAPVASAPIRNDTLTTATPLRPVESNPGQARAAAQQRAREARPAASFEGGSRAQRTFSDLSRNAP